MNLNTLDQPTARLVQLGLQSLGLYQGTTVGLPGPKTLAAYQRYLDALAQPQPAAPLTLPELVARIAENEVGVREEPRDSNSGPRVEEYQGATWLDGTGWPWCAAFVCWCVLRASERTALRFARPQTAGAWDFIRWADAQKLQNFDPRARDAGEIRRGDIVVFTFSHIGICTATSIGDPIHTVEGNTDAAGSREGGGVYAKQRRREQIRRVIRLAAQE